MTVRTLLIAAFFLFTVNVFGQKPAFFEMKGVVETDYTGTIFLYHYDANGKLLSDKGLIKDHQFYFKNKLGKPHQGYLVLAGTFARANIYIDTGSIKVAARIDSLMAGERSVIDLVLTKITGSKSQAIWDEAMAFFNKYKPTDYNNPAAMAQKFAKVNQLSKKYPNLDVTCDIVLFVRGSISGSQLKTVYANLSKKQQERAINYGIRKTLDRQEKLVISEPVYFPSQTDAEGKKLVLTDLTYNYLLIDFWASNCGPCRQEHPGMISLYNQYKSQGFEIVGVSLDKERTNWLEAIRQDKLPWKQVSDLNEFQTDIVQHYSLEYIPFNILIDKKGKIIATELRGERL
ncbi:MAG: hypothetical protein JWQ30_1276, partial [Sediminibacterium sp.]|nr:hypothetical protein [Sediminibacterium sp.]